MSPRVRLILNAATGVCAALVRPAVSLVTLPALAIALGAGQLGLWMIALSLVAVSSAVNSGLSAAIVSEVGQAATNNDEADAFSAIVTRGVLLACVSATLILVPALSLIAFFDVRLWFNASEIISAQSANAMLLVLVLSLCVGFLSQVPKSIAIGKRDGFFANLSDAIAVTVGALVLLILIWLRQPIEALAAAYALVPAVLLCAFGLMYLSRSRIKAAPVKLLSIKPRGPMVKRTLQMTLHQGLLSVNQNSDVLLIGIMAGPELAAIYGIAQRLAALVVFIITPINHAVWPELTVMAASGKANRLRKLFGYLLTTTLIVGVCFSALFFLFANSVIEIFFGTAYRVDIILLGGFAAWTISFTLVNSFEMLLRARQNFSFLASVSLLGVSFSVGAKVLAAATFGMNAIPWVGAAALSMMFVVPYLVKSADALGGVRLPKATEERY